MSTVANAGTEAKRVLIACQLDRYANGFEPVEVERFLRARGHQVRLVHTYSPQQSGKRAPEVGPGR